MPSIELRAFRDPVDLIGYEAVCLPVHRHRWLGVGRPRFAIRCLLRPWPRCLGVRSTTGPSQSWRNHRAFRVRCSTRVFVRSWVLVTTDLSVLSIARRVR